MKFATTEAQKHIFEECTSGILKYAEMTESLLDRIKNAELSIAFKNSFNWDRENSDSCELPLLVAAYLVSDVFANSATAAGEAISMYMS